MVYLLPKVRTYQSHVGNSMESLQIFLEEGMETAEETKGINLKLILPTLKKNSMYLNKFYHTSTNN